MEQAAGVSLVALTAAQAIWYRLGLQAPFAYDRDQVFQEHPDWRATHNEADGPSTTNALIYGASTSWHYMRRRFYDSVPGSAAKLSNCTASLAKLDGNFSK